MEPGIFTLSGDRLEDCMVLGLLPPPSMWVDLYRHYFIRGFYWKKKGPTLTNNNLVKLPLSLTQSVEFLGSRVRASAIRPS